LSYFPSQFSAAAASAAISAEINSEIEEKDQEVQQLVSLVKKELNKKNKNWGLIKKKEAEINVIETEIALLKIDLEYIPLFHPRDSIYAIQSRDILVGSKVEKKYIVAVQQENGERLTKEVTLEWLQEAFEPEVFEYFMKHEEEKGWVVLTNGNPALVDIDDDDLDALYQGQQIFTYQNPEKTVRVNAVKAHIFMDTKISKRIDQKANSTAWFIKTEKSNNAYIYVKPEELKDIMSDATFIEMETQAKARAIADCNNRQQFGHAPDYSDRYFDTSDKEYWTAINNLGDRDHVQIFYWDLKTDKLKHLVYSYNETKTQISRLRYRIEDDTWHGYQIVDKKVVVLETIWVMQQFPEDVIDRCIDEARRGNREFIRLPVGDVIEVVPTMDISRNPIVKYQQGNLDICAFASLASALFHLGWTEEAKLLYNFGVEWTLFHEDSIDKSLENIARFIPKQKIFKHFRSKYEQRKIKYDYDIFQPVLQNEIRLIVIIMSDNSETHAVTVVNNYVFDANCTNALPRTQEGLDCCCGVDANFVSVSRGYHWVDKKRHV
jgi:hypothetical protein